MKQTIRRAGQDDSKKRLTSLKRAAIEKFAVKYMPGDTSEHRSQVIGWDWSPLCMLGMVIEHMTGKEAIELRKVK